MDVPSREEFEDLKQEVKKLSNLVKQLNSVRVTQEWVSLEVATILLNCSRTTIWRMIKNNQLSVEKSNKKVRIGLASIRAYLISRRYEPEVVEARIRSLFEF